MKELLSTTRNLHHLLILLCFALLPVAARIDEKGHLELAQRELVLLGDYSSESLRDAFLKKMEEEGKKYVDRIIPADVRSSMGLPNVTWTIHWPIASALPDRTSTLTRWNNYLSPVGIRSTGTPAWLICPSWSPAETAHSVWSDWLKQFGSQPTRIDSAFLQLSLPASVAHLTYEIPEIVASPENIPNGQLTIILTSYQTSDHPAKSWTAQEQVAVTAQKIRDYAGRSYMSKYLESRLLGKDVLTPGHTIPQSEFLPEAKRYWSDISAMSAQEAGKYLRQKAVAIEPPQKLFQVDFGTNQLFFAAPLLLASVLLYFVAHLRWARKKLGTLTTLPVDDVNWLVLFPGLLPCIILWLTIFFLPALVTSLLIFRIVDPSEELVFGWALIVVVSIQAVWTAMEATVLRNLWLRTINQSSTPLVLEWQAAKLVNKWPAWSSLWRRTLARVWTAGESTWRDFPNLAKGAHRLWIGLLRRITLIRGKKDTTTKHE